MKNIEIIYRSSKLSHIKFRLAGFLNVGSLKCQAQHLDYELNRSTALVEQYYPYN